MDVLVERVAGIDIAKGTMAVTARVPDGSGGRRSTTRTYGTVTGEVLKARDWLLEQGVTLVAMEATGVYWKPVFYLLEDAMGVWLCNATHIKAVPGRKTDVRDSEWIAQLVEHGLITPSFVPPPPIRELREFTRYRKAVIEERTREVQRLEKLLEDAGIKISSVASSTLGASARRMIEAMIAGERDPEALADLAKASLRRKIPQLREALVGRFGVHHALLAQEMLRRIDGANATIDRLSAEIDARIEPFRRRLELLITIPGIDRRSAEVIIAETGGDMAVFGSAARLASWAGMCPGSNESAGKRKSGRTRKGSKWLRSALVESAYAASRTRDTYLKAQFWRLAHRRGKKRAAVAVGHTILDSIYQMLSTDQPYRELGGDYYATRDSQRHTRRLVHQLEALGNKVTIEPITAA